MTDRLVYFFGDGQAEGGGDLRHLVGGKGASLADMTRAGLNVPPGFTISAACCDHYYKAGRQWPAGLAEAVAAGIERLERLVGRPFGRGTNPLLVAVRSGAAQSMPGMMDTVLNVGLEDDPAAQLRQAITAVFDSWNSERAVSYRQRHGIEGLLGTAVTVQAMCPAEVSGVLFTANPVNRSREELVIESTHGLGEALVLGKVTPDHFVLTRPDLRILARTPGAQGKGSGGVSLTDAQLIELARLGLRVEAYFGVPCDIEWGLAGGQFYLLQSRPIQGLADRPDEAEREQVRREEIAALAALAEPGGTVWARYNLAEVLPEPTPLTWAIVQRFLSGRGGFGLMYRDLGFDPDPSLDERGVFDLVCGRPYCNLSREPRMQYRQLPFEHPFALLKAEPSRALYPQPVFNPARAGWRFWLLLPALFVKLFRSAVRLRRMSRDFAEHFRAHVVPAFVAETERAAGEDLSQLDTSVLLQRLEHWIRRTLYEFARDSLKPTALAAVALGNLERALARRKQAGAEVPQVRDLVMGVRPDPEADLAGAVQDLAAGRLDRAAFLARFGHRGPQEMELAQPRWAEDPAALEHLYRSGGSEPPGSSSEGSRPPLGGVEAALQAELQTLHTYLALRETAKHHLLRGYALVRRVLVELDRRFDLQGGIFYLTPPELPRLTEPGAVAELKELGARRRRRRAVALALPVPQVLFSDDLEAIGRPLDLAAQDTLQGVPLSAGTAEGPALVLQTPTRDDLPAEPYILVCPSTDPAWYPLFLKARGLVMETGGVLSHGAIAARELGLPAVAGLPEIQHRIRTGQRLRVSGGTGRVDLLA